MLRRARWGAPLTAGARARTEPEPGRRARSCSRRHCRAPECHLRDTRQPAGSGGGGRLPSQPAGSGHGRSDPGPAGGGHEPCPGLRLGVWGARQSPPLHHLPRTPLPGSCQSPPRPSISCCDAPPLRPPQSLSRAFRLRHSPLRRAGGGGGGRGR